jgi:hypothetical protein
MGRLTVSTERGKVHNPAAGYAGLSVGGKIVVPSQVYGKIELPYDQINIRVAAPAYSASLGVISYPFTPVYDEDRGFYALTSAGGLWYSKDGITFSFVSPGTAWGNAGQQVVAAGIIGNALVVHTVEAAGIDTKMGRVIGGIFDRGYNGLGTTITRATSSTAYPVYKPFICRSPDYAGVAADLDTSSPGSSDRIRSQTILADFILRKDPYGDLTVSTGSIFTAMTRSVNAIVAVLLGRLSTSLYPTDAALQVSALKLFFNPWSRCYYLIDNNSSSITKLPVIGPKVDNVVYRDIGAAGPYISMAISSDTTFALLRRGSGTSRYTYDGGKTWQPTSGISYGGPVATGLVNKVPTHVTMRSNRILLPIKSLSYVETYTSTSCGSWTAKPRSSDMAMDCADICWGDTNNNDTNGMFVAVGNDMSTSRMLYSPDGSTWKKCSLQDKNGNALPESVLADWTMSAICYA